MFDPIFIKILSDYNRLRLHMINHLSNYHAMEVELKKKYRLIKEHKSPVTQIADEMTLFQETNPLFFNYYDDWWFEYYKKK
jgi:hypothetical protein